MTSAHPLLGTSIKAKSFQNSFAHEIVQEETFAGEKSLTYPCLGIRISTRKNKIRHVHYFQTENDENRNLPFGLAFGMCATEVQAQMKRAPDANGSRIYYDRLADGMSDDELTAYLSAPKALAFWYKYYFHDCTEIDIWFNPIQSSGLFLVFCTSWDESFYREVTGAIQDNLKCVEANKRALQQYGSVQAMIDLADSYCLSASFSEARELYESAIALAQKCSIRTRTRAKFTYAYFLYSQAARDDALAILLDCLSELNENGEERLPELIQECKERILTVGVSLQLPVDRVRSLLKHGK